MSEGVSLLFPAFNRLAFTKQSWAALMANTDWSLVSELHVYDDGSTDGAREWLQQQPQIKYAGCLFSDRLHFHETSFRSPMGVTLDWIKQSSAPILAKLDNDTIYPPGWLNIALDVMDRNHKLDCLGLECMRAPAQMEGEPWPVEYSYRTRSGALLEFGYLPAAYISGLGLYRRSAFRTRLPADHGYFGFEEFMAANCKSGWILPSLPTILLDRLPMEPWKSLSDDYVSKGWQRPLISQASLAPGVRTSPADRYRPEQHAMWDWWRPV